MSIDPQPDKSSDMHHEHMIRKAVITIVIVITLGSLLAYLTTQFLKPKAPKAETHDYNGFEFTKQGNFWYTDWVRTDGQNYTFEFRNSPWDVENITVTGTVNEIHFQRPYVYITFDPTNETNRQTAFVAVAGADLATMLKNVFNKVGVTAACTANITDACAGRPIVTCDTPAAVIYLKVSNDTAIVLDDNCATIQGAEENLTKAADKAIYQWLGIIKK